MLRTKNLPEGTKIFTSEWIVRLTVKDTLIDPRRLNDDDIPTAVAVVTWQEDPELVEQVFGTADNPDDPEALWFSIPDTEA